MSVAQRELLQRIAQTPIPQEARDYGYPIEYLGPLALDALRAILGEVADLEAQLARAETTYREARNQLAAHGIAEHPGIVTQIDLLAARAQYAESRAVEWRAVVASLPCDEAKGKILNTVRYDETLKNLVYENYDHATQCVSCRARAEKAGEG